MTRDTDHSALRAAFETAFAAPVVATGKVTRCTRSVCAECDRIRAGLGGHSWRTVAPDLIDALDDALPLLTPEAFHAFLPISVLRSVERLVTAPAWVEQGPDQEDGALASVLFNLVEIEPDFLAPFSRGERDAVCAFLLFVKAEPRLVELSTEAGRALVIWSA